MWNYDNYIIVLATSLSTSYSKYLNKLDIRLKRVLLNTLPNSATNARCEDVVGRQ
jgi:hypothetical protein